MMFKIGVSHEITYAHLPDGLVLLLLLDPNNLGFR